MKIIIASQLVNQTSQREREGEREKKKYTSKQLLLSGMNLTFYFL